MADAVLPGESVAPIAENIAERPRFVAVVFTVIGAFFVLAGISLITHPEKANLSPAGAIVGMGFWVLLCFGLRVAFMRRAQRLLAAAARAKADPSVTWFLRGKRIIATDGSGAPVPRLSFKIRQAHVEMLSVMPTARVV